MDPRSKAHHWHGVAALAIARAACGARAAIEALPEAAPATRRAQA